MYLQLVSLTMVRRYEYIFTNNIYTKFCLILNVDNRPFSSLRLLRYNRDKDKRHLHSQATPSILYQLKTVP